MTLTRNDLEKLYKKYNKREFVHPDPLEFLYNYPNIRDREITGLIASSLAYGRVSQILKSVRTVLQKMGDSPFNFLIKTPDEKIKKVFKGFKHRFTTGNDISAMLAGVKKVVKKYGSLGECFIENAGKTDTTYIPAISRFVSEMNIAGNPFLLPKPEMGSACKRLNLYLRWMIRRDDVDPGGWGDLSAAKLIVPLDTHMFWIGKKLGFTKRKQANLRTAIEITEAFSKFSPDDPVKYDFTLTRFGIRDDMGAVSNKFFRKQVAQNDIIG